MSSDVEIYFLYREEFTTEFLSRLSEHMSDLAASSSGEEHEGELTYYWFESDGVEAITTGDFDVLAERVLSNSDGWFELAYGDLPFSVSVNDAPVKVPSLPNLRLEIESAYFDEVNETTESGTVSVLLDIVKELYHYSAELTDAPYVYGVGPGFLEVMYEDDDLQPTTEAGVRSGELEYVYWLQLIPPRMVATTVRDSIESTPAWKNETLHDGSVLLVVHEQPKFWDEYSTDTANAHLDLL